MIAFVATYVLPALKWTAVGLFLLGVVAELNLFRHDRKNRKRQA